MKQFISAVLVFTIYFGAITPFSTKAQTVRGKTREIKQTNMNQLPTTNGLQFRLSEGTEGAETREVQPTVKADPLSEGETSNLLKRIPAVKEQTDDKTDFAKRAGSLPPPKTGKIVNVKFPSDEGRGTPKVNIGNSLEVVRFSPEGEVSLAPDLSVTFSQPMIAVTSQEQASENVPIQLSPQTEGKWRWLGTKTLMFDTTKRFPMATTFTARIPAGTKSINGQTLSKDVVWTFTTPPPKVETMIPANDQITRRDALIFVSFDQAINPGAVLQTISVTAGKQKIKTRLATQEEIENDESIKYYAKQAQPNRWLVFRAVNSDGLPENALPADSTITVTVEKGTPSAEGPLTTTKAQSFSFKTYGAMKFVGGWCNYQNSKTCSPFDTWFMQFSNPIDAESFAVESVKVEPKIEGLKIFPSGNYIYLQGVKKGNTTYKVTIETLKDTFGQTLDKPATAIFKVGSAPANLYSQGGNFVVLDPTAKPAYSIYSTNQPSVKVKIYAVTPQDWEAFRLYMRNQYVDVQKRPKIPGRLVVDKVQQITNKPDEMVETRLDLSEALKNGFGNAIIEIEPTVKRDQYDRTKITVWAEATNIGLDAFVDNQELVGFATDLKNGKPLTGVELSIYPNGKSITEKSSVDAPEQSWTEWFGELFASNEKPHGPQIVGENGQTSDIEEIAEAQSNQTTDNGILRLSLPDEQSKMQNLLIARKGEDVAFLPEQSDYYYQDYGNWYKKPSPDSSRWFVFDDRKMYRPKEEVSIKGYIRTIEGGKLGDVALLANTNEKITYKLVDPQGNEVLKGETNLNAFGAFDFKFKLTDTMNLGNASLQMGRNGSYDEFYHNIQVQEFRRPEFEVTSKVDSQAPFFVGGKADLSVEAKYYAGGGLANAETNWTVTATPTNYTPPNRGDFTFGKWFPWWRGGDNYYGNTTTQTFKGVTDASGIHRLKIDFESANPPRPYTVTASSSVQDVNRQTWSSSTSLLVHSADLYVGIRTKRTFVQKNENIEVESIVSDIDGKLIANRDVEIKAVLMDWVFDKGKWEQKTVDEQTCSIKSSEKPEQCKFIAKAGGVYTITARVMDDRERVNESELTVWVPGGKTPPQRNVTQEEVQLIPSQKDFAPNEVAEILVQSPFVPAEGVLTLRRDGIVKTERFTMNDSTTTLKIPLEEKYLPNIIAQVDLVGAAPRVPESTAVVPTAVLSASRTQDGEAGRSTDSQRDAGGTIPKRPAFASGQINLQISTDSRKLTVAAEPAAKTVEPGGTTKINVEVKDNTGEPVANTEVAVVVVDESVLALTGYRLGNPLDVFYSLRGDGVSDYHLRKDILLGNDKDIKPEELPKGTNFTSELKALPINGRDVGNLDLMQMAPGVMAKSEMTIDGFAQSTDPHGFMFGMSAGRRNARADKDSKEGNPETPINLRTNFNALALFAPSVKTDANGKATVDLKLPDNLTRYRVMAVSVDKGKRFGLGESNLTAKQPLMVRPSAPRFMNFGDKIELPVVVQNQTDKEMTVDVGVRATNANLTNGGGRQGDDCAERPRRSSFSGQRRQSRNRAFPIRGNFGKFLRRGGNRTASVDTGDDRSVCDLRHD